MTDSQRFQVFCSNHPSILVGVAARQIEAAMAQQPMNDLRPIPVLVPSAAMRDRLRDDLAEKVGICAGVELLLPAEFGSRWLPQRLGVSVRDIDTATGRWRVCAALDAAPQIAPTRRDAWDARRLALATRLTDSLVRLSHWAAHLTMEPWAAGRRGPFDADYPYLQGLWSALVGTHDPRLAHRALLDAIAQAPELPPLVLAFATPDLAPPLLEVLTALSRRTQVQIVLSQPVPGDWSDQGLAWKQGADADAAWSNRLLAHWGVEHRHALRRLDAVDADIRSEDRFFVPAERRTLLAQVQRDLLAGQAPTPGTIREDDVSLVFQHAYGPRAEAEALKHRLVAWMQADRIAPHQVCIACPDPDTYAPMLAAICASAGEGPPVPVDVRISQGLADPAATVALTLLDLLPGRWTASQVLSLLTCAPVADAWNLDARWQRQVCSWCDAADLRFGADASHRGALGLPADASATWRRGLQRLSWSCFLGADTTAIDLHTWVAPVDEVDERGVIGIEVLAEILLPLLDAASDWRLPHPAAWWAGQITALTRHLRGGLLDASDAHLGHRLGHWQQELVDAGANAALLTADLVSQVVQDTGTSAPLRGGGIAIGTPAALRGHPWAIVCCLGMGDGAFPRQVTGADVDPLVHNPVPGQPDPRHQDRAALLDLLIAAEAHVLISWTGHDPRSGEPLPPCPAIGDLLDVARVSAGVASAGELIDVIGLGADTGVAPGPWPSAARRDQAAAIPAGVSSALVPAAPLPEPVLAVISLDDLRYAIADPPMAFLRRLGIRIDETTEAPEDYERLVLDDSLESWKLRDELVDHLRAGQDVEPLLERWTATGQIPGGTWGRFAIQPEIARVQAMIAATHERWTASTDSADTIRVTLADGTMIRGRCPRIHPTLGPVRQNPGGDKAKHRQRAWLEGLLWQADGHPGGGVLLHEKGECIIPAYTSTREALTALTDLIAWYRRCLCMPTPLMPDLVAAIAKVLDADPAQVLPAARKIWTERNPNSPVPPLCESAAVRLLWPAGADALALDGATLQREACALGARQWGAVPKKTAADAGAGDTRAGPPAARAGKRSTKPGKG